MTTFTAIHEFTPDQFTPTKWERADKKAKFARQFIKFVEADFDRKQFPLWFYRRLSQTFGMIAHYDQHGFYGEFFTTTQYKVRFLKQMLAHPCHGDPVWTYSDVEKALQSWLFQNAVLFRYENRLAEEQEAEERADLARLQTKYGNNHF